MVDLRGGGHPRLQGLRRWAPSYRRGTWHSALAGLGVGDTETALAWARSFEAQQRRGHPLLPGAAAAVRALAGRYRLALLTNGPPDIQQHKVRATGLSDCFETVVISGEVGVAKPDRRVFDLLLEQLDGATAGSTVMVGDDWDRDVLGATAAGWSTIWVSAGRTSPDASSDVPSVTSVAEVVALFD